MDSRQAAKKRIFVEAGKPVAVMDSATKDMCREANSLVILPDKRWGTPLFVDQALMKGDFHIHARLTLDELEGTGISFLLGGHYHYPCSRPEGNVAFRVSLYDDMEVYDGNQLDTPGQIVCGMTERRAPWSEAEKEVVGKAVTIFKPANLSAWIGGRRERSLASSSMGRKSFIRV